MKKIEIIDKNIKIETLFKKYFPTDKQLLIILTGNIGTGKSSFASKITSYSKKFIIINDDAIITMISGTYLNYDKNKSNLYKTIENQCIFCSLVHRFNVIIDMPNVKQSSRKRFIDIAKQFNPYIISIDFGIGSILNLNYRKKENRGYNNWEEVFNRKKREYIESSLDEEFNLLLNVR